MTVSRREFLQWASAAAGTAAVSGCASSGRQRRQGGRHRRRLRRGDRRQVHPALVARHRGHARRARRRICILPAQQPCDRRQCRHPRPQLQLRRAQAPRHHRRARRGGRRRRGEARSAARQRQRPRLRPPDRLAGRRFHLQHDPGPQQCRRARPRAARLEGGAADAGAAQAARIACAMAASTRFTFRRRRIAARRDRTSASARSPITSSAPNRSRKSWCSTPTRTSSRRRACSSPPGTASTRA